MAHTRTRTFPALGWLVAAFAAVAPAGATEEPGSRIPDRTNEAREACIDLKDWLLERLKAERDRVYRIYIEKSKACKGKKACLTNAKAEADKALEELGRAQYAVAQAELAAGLPESLPRGLLLDLSRYAPDLQTRCMSRGSLLNKN